MTFEEAKLEAKRRWPLDGGWAESNSQAYTPAGRCKVGILLPLPGGVTKRKLGSGSTFELAFQRAQRKLEGKRKGGKRKAPAGLPTVELELEGKK